MDYMNNNIVVVDVEAEVDEFEVMLAQTMPATTPEQREENSDPVPVALECERLKKAIEEVEEETKRKKAALVEWEKNVRAEAARYIEEKKAECERLKQKERQLQKQYKQDKAKTAALEKDVEKLKKTRMELVQSEDMTVSLGLFKLLGINAEKGTCPEGKPIGGSGSAGTCNYWDCPLVNGQIGQKCCAGGGVGGGK